MMAPVRYPRNRIQTHGRVRGYAWNARNDQGCTTLHRDNDSVMHADPTEKQP
jgi:hypothetical protein